VTVAAQRHDGAEHCQPQEQELGQLVSLNERAVEDVARDHGEEDDGLDQHQHRADHPGEAADLQSRANSCVV
jgi:hypothetical protein